MQGVLAQVQAEARAGGEPGEELQVRLAVLQSPRERRTLGAGLDRQARRRGELGGDIGSRHVAPHAHGARQPQPVQRVVPADADGQDAVGAEVMLHGGDPAGEQRRRRARHRDAQRRPDVQARRRAAGEDQLDLVGRRGPLADPAPGQPRGVGAVQGRAVDLDAHPGNGQHGGHGASPTAGSVGAAGMRRMAPAGAQGASSRLLATARKRHIHGCPG